MKFNAPAQITFFLALAFAVVALVARVTPIQNVTPNAFWILLAAYAVLVVGCVYRRR
jgi:hypothetical protein